MPSPPATALALLLAGPLAAQGGAEGEPAPPWPVATATWIDADSLTLDGDPGEWRGEGPPDVAIDRLDQLVQLGPRPPGEQWSGPQDASLELWVGWNDEDLVLGGEVRDDVADYDAGTWHRGDSLELFLNTRDREEAWGPDDFQVMLAPDWSERPWGVYVREGGATRASDGGFGGMEIVSQPFLGGYRFEARIPWRNFELHAPRAGARLPFNMAQCDRDGRGMLESYATWTAEAAIAVLADRRGELVLEPPSTERAVAASQEADSERPRIVLLVLLAGTYALALATRRIWRRPRSKLRGVIGAAVLLVAAGGVSLSARLSTQSETQERRARLEDYWTDLDGLLRSGALGHPEPEALRQRVSALLSDRSIAPVGAERLHALAPEGAGLGRERATARRGLSYQPIQANPQAPSRPGVDVAPEGRIALDLGGVREIDSVLLVTQVSDPRSLRVREQVSVLSVEVERAGEVLEAREVRHRQDLHPEEDEHRDRPGLEPAFYAPGGRLGRVHGDGILLQLDSPREVDRVVVRHVGGSAAYTVRLIAAAAREVDPSVVPDGLRATPEGDLKWPGWRSEVAAEVTPPGRAPRKTLEGALVRRLALGEETVGLVHLADTTPAPAGSSLDSLPIATLAFLAPFLVALLAEWLATRRRIRGKLAVGFAVSSAVPLLALTLLLDASLGQEHELFESERARQALARAEQDLEAEQRELEREALWLLQIAELEKKVAGLWPERASDLDAWWGASEGALRLFERVSPEGRRIRLGTGPRWREVPPGYTFKSGLQRPWGGLYVCGVAQTASGAEQPLTVVVARPPELPGSRAVAPAPSATPAGSAAASGARVRLVGGGRDPSPRVEDLSARGPRELRRPLYGGEGDELVGVLVASWGERGVPVLGDYTLTELLLAAGLTALFTALLFAGILTGHLVGPIERLDRAVREGRATEVQPEVDDEIGHLTSAIRATSSEIGQRVRQLETLQVAHEELSRQLDVDRARQAVLHFFELHAGARTLLLAWTGESGEVPRLFALGGAEGVRTLSPPEPGGLVQRALTAGAVLHFRDAPGLPSVSEAERALLGPVERVLALPLVAAGGVRGALLVGYQASDSAPDLAFLRAASAQAAIVLENARLYHQAVSDGVTGFLTDPGFRQRLAEEILRAEGAASAGVLVVRLRLTRLPEDDRQAAERLRETARRMRLAVRGLALFGRSGSADLQVAMPWTGRRPGFEAIEQRVVDRVASAPWPDGEAVEGLLSSHAAWPVDGPSARFVLHLAEERLSAVQSGAPAPNLAALRERLPPDFVAGSPNMVQLLETVRRLSEQEVTLLVSGETGTGKDRLAELVHRWSPRRGGPLVHVHCPSLSSGLIEDELFGHEKGAFTGAHTRRVGPFEYASGGTVVLDEVGGLSSDGQVALLRVLESREVLPLGAQRPAPIDVRVVATSSRDLASEVEAGRFRGDLYFRLNVAQVTIPPLRLRRQALPELVQAFVKRFNASADRPVTGVDSKVLDELFEHDWPGNVRELENVLARGLILAEGTELRPEHVELGGLDGGAAWAGAAEGLNPRQEQLLRELLPGDPVTSADHAARHAVSGRTALRDLLELVERGWLLREGQRRGTRFRRTRGRTGAHFVQ